MKTLTHLDLFSGIGGFSIAAQNCGYTTIGFCEKEPYAQQILKERFGAGAANGPRIHPDIFTLNGADYAGVDLLTGGFPCQPFSVAGKRLGKEDDRALWPEMLRVINGANPRWIIGENVAGIVTMELDNILSDLEGIGYSAWPIVIPACAVDARHRRDRVWIVAHSERSASGQGRAERRGAIGAGTCDESSGSGEDVAHANGERGRLREGHGEDASDAGESPRPRKRQDGGQLESAILRMADGIPEGLDSGGGFCQWPEEDHETPRVTTGMKHRAHRLRGLGNSIVPSVACEIIRAIVSCGR